MLNIAGESEISPKEIEFEQKGDIKVGRLVIPIITLQRWEPTPMYLRFLNALNGSHPQVAENAARLRRSLSFSLNNNTPNSQEPIKHERGASAYFTYDPDQRKVIIEWGMINPLDGEAKLHKYLNQVTDYPERIRQGMKLTSGHIARISGDEEIYLAFLDNLITNDRTLTNKEPRGKLVNALYSANFIPLTSEAFVQLPVFI